MKKRSARIYYVSFLLVILGFVLYAFVKTFNENLLYYRSPTQLVNGNFPDNYIFRIGGMVEEGSLIRVSGTKKVSFNVTDFNNKVLVKYDGILPDLFREGQGVVIRGYLQNNLFVAEEVLAKHDETYMPPEVKESLGLMKMVNIKLWRVLLNDYRDWICRALPSTIRPYELYYFALAKSINKFKYFTGNIVLCI